VRQDDGSSVSGGMAYDRGCKPIQCKRVDYGVKESSDWLVFRLGLRQKKSEREMCASFTQLCNKAKDVCGKSSAPLQSVIKCVMILPVPGRNYDHSVERN
jgi:hypothetical protein